MEWTSARAGERREHGCYRAVRRRREQNCLQSQEIERLAQTAAENGAEMLFLPEYSMYYAKVNARSKNIEAAERCDGAFIIALGELCRRYGLWIAAGMYERTDGLPYNTIAVLDDRGRLRGTHRKNRLYDAFGYRESDECRAGTSRFRPSRHPLENWVSLPASSFGFRRWPPSRRRAAPRRCSFRRAGCRAKSCCTGAPCCAREPSRMV